MQFGTYTRIVLQDQRPRAIEPQLKTMIVAAAQRTVKNLQHIISDGDWDAGDLDVEISPALDAAPVYAVLRGKAAGRKDSVLLYETSKVLVEKSAYEHQLESLALIGAAAVADGETSTPPAVTLDEPVRLTADKITISMPAMLVPVSQYYQGSPIRIINSGVNSTLVGLPSDAKAAMTGKNIVAMYFDTEAKEIAYTRFVANNGGGWVAEGEAITGRYVALYEDPFSLMTDNVAHGTIYIDYVYNDDDLADTMYYLEDLDAIRTAFGDDSLSMIPSGAGYNAHKYFQANGGREGFYVYAVAPNASEMYLTDTEIAVALSNTTRYTDVYDVIPITYDPAVLSSLDSHLTTMSNSEMRGERRGYAGVYMPKPQGLYYQYDEFPHLCEIGATGERNYMLGVTEENGGTGRYGGRTAYINAMMLKNIYTSSPKLTLCETKYGVIDGSYVTASTLMAVYVAFRRTFTPGYVLAETTLPLISSVSFAGILEDIDGRNKLQNAGILTIYQGTVGGPVRIYYPCTAATNPTMNGEEYIVTSIDQFARELRATYDQFIARGTDNKIAANFAGVKATRYKQKLQMAIDPLKTKYIEDYKAFDSVTLLEPQINPDYEGGVMLGVVVVPRWAVNNIEVIIYI